MQGRWAHYNFNSKRPANAPLSTGALRLQVSCNFCCDGTAKACDSRELLLSQSFPSRMAAPEVHLLFHHPIADHSFSADRNTLAVARDNNVELYQRSGTKFTLQDELKGHDKTVTSVDIAPSTGRIVTCSQGALPALLPPAFY